MKTSSESSKTFKDRFYRLPEIGIDYDCEFIIVGTDTDNVVVEGHRFIFAVASDVFKAMFYGELTEEKSVQIEDLDPEGFKGLKQYIYTSEISLTSVKHASSIYLAAHKYMIAELRSECFKYIENNIKPSEVLELYEWCETNRIISEFEALCSKLIKEKTEEVVDDYRSKYLLPCKPSTVEMFLKSPSLRLDSELQVFTHFERWAHAEIDRENISDDSKVASHFNDLKKHIRFLTMKPEELTSRVAKSRLLTDEEKRAIGCALMNSNSTLPDTLSPIKESRKFIPKPTPIVNPTPTPINTRQQTRRIEIKQLRLRTEK
ncbi:hypothetical protein LSTR_LSTR008779 [Laodelphax striatellus]|uniref:BTB domain-containing protein n=1 Tax=Laodelphax striatellus TaxID=195883 RepID=A0A482X3A4_LAOST|nr:hypothetical protein LSTR_LSTR008779 [Laodelphax striatellus]